MVSEVTCGKMTRSVAKTISIYIYSQIQTGNIDL